MIKSLLVARRFVRSCARRRWSTPSSWARRTKPRVTGLYVLDVRYLEMPPYLDYSYTFEAVPPAVRSRST